MNQERENFDAAFDGDDPFDAELRTLFEQAAPPAEDPIFTAHILSATQKPDRTRLLALGGAGATGSAVAGTQLESLISGPAGNLGGVMGQAAAFAGPEAIVSGLFAVLALGIAWVIPKGRLGLG